jgi:hypothetical protein
MFVVESEAERRALFDKVRIGKNLHPNEYHYLTFSGVLPVTLPDNLRMVALPDVHCPAHNKRVFWSVLQFLKWYRPHVVLFIGDVADMFQLSTWPKHPRTRVNPQGEIDDTRDLIYKVMKSGPVIDNVQTGPFWVLDIEGNHEDRIIRYLTKVCPTLAHFLDAKTREPIVHLPNLMGFKPDDPITFITGRDERGGFEGGICFNEQLHAEHGSIVKPVPGASVQAHCEKYHRSTMTGHTHRMGTYSRQVLDKEIYGVELGCLVDIEHPYFAYAGATDWHLGFGVVNVLNGKVHVQPVPIQSSLDDRGQLQYYFTYADKVFVSSDR